MQTAPATSKAEVIRNAVAVYHYLKGSLPSQGGIQTIEISDFRGEKKHVLIP